MRMPCAGICHRYGEENYIFLAPHINKDFTKPISAKKLWGRKQHPF